MSPSSSPICQCCAELASRRANTRFPGTVSLVPPYTSTLPRSLPQPRGLALARQWCTSYVLRTAAAAAAASILRACAQCICVAPRRVYAAPELLLRARVGPPLPLRERQWRLTQIRLLRRLLCYPMCRLRAVTFERPDRSAEQREGAMKRAETERRNVKISHFPDSRKKNVCSLLRFVRTKCCH